MRLACAGGLLSVAAAATTSWAFQDPAPVGLSGIMPKDIPSGLEESAWQVLGPNWTDWGTETFNAVSDLYPEEGDLGDLAAQHAILAKLRVKLGTMEKALADSQYRVIHSPLTGLHSKLARRVDVAEALLSMLDTDERVKLANAQLDAAVTALRDDLDQVPGGSAWLPYVRADQLAAAAASNDRSPEALERLASVQKKIDGRESLSDAAQRDFLGRDSFARLSGAIGDVLTADAPEQTENIRKEAVRLVEAIEDNGERGELAYERDGNDAAAEELNSAYEALLGLSSDGGDRISAVIGQHYFGPNMRIIASESFLRKTVGESRTEQGYINEPVSEAWVSGVSCTYTNVSVDLQPNSNVAQLNLHISGTVQANTTANAAQAVVYGGSTGNFSATKPIKFSGQEFSTDPARVNANASTYANDVDAKVFFLLRPIADIIAENEVAKRKPQNDALARQRIMNQVSQNVNTETDSRFADANLKLQSKLFGPLRELRWQPQEISTYSTDSEMVIGALLRESEENKRELGAQQLVGMPAVPENGIAIQVHESLLNNGADRLDVAGKTLTDAELRKLIEDRISTLLGREFKFTKPTETADGAPAPAVEEAPKGSNSYIFAETDPLRFQIDDGNVSIVLRTGLIHTEDGKTETIEQHVISVPLTFSIEGGKVAMKRGDVRVAPAPGTSVSIPRQGIMRRTIQDSIQDRTLDGQIKIEQDGGKTITMDVTSIDAQDGWVTVLAK